MHSTKIVINNNACELYTYTRIIKKTFSIKIENDVGMSKPKKDGTRLRG